MCQKQTGFLLFAHTISRAKEKPNKMCINACCMEFFLKKKKHFCCCEYRKHFWIFAAYNFEWKATYVTMLNWWNCISHWYCCIVISDCRMQYEIIILVMLFSYSSHFCVRRCTHLNRYISKRTVLTDRRIQWLANGSCYRMIAFSRERKKDSKRCIFLVVNVHGFSCILHLWTMIITEYGNFQCSKAFE